MRNQKKDFYASLAMGTAYSFVLAFGHGFSLTSIITALILGPCSGIVIYFILAAVYKTCDFFGVETDHPSGRPLHPFVNFLLLFTAITVPVVVVLSFAGIIFP